MSSGQVPSTGRVINAVFRPEAFEAADRAQAMRVTVTPEQGVTTEERWATETPFIVDDIARHLPIGPETCVLDYGCGLGRIAKGLIDKLGCRVVGVDASKSMRLLSPEYVLSERFTAWSPEVLETMIGKGFRADFAISIWVIQHVLYPEKVIQQIALALKPQGMAYTLNQTFRCVPTDLGWVDDGYKVRESLARIFIEEESHILPAEVTIPVMSPNTIIQVLKQRSE